MENQLLNVNTVIYPLKHLRWSFSRKKVTALVAKVNKLAVNK